MTYDIFRHRYNFALWTAAGAAQPGFTSVGKLRYALECSGVGEFVRDHACSEIDASDFEKRHAGWCSKIIEALKNQVCRMRPSVVQPNWWLCA